MPAEDVVKVFQRFDKDAWRELVAMAVPGILFLFVHMWGPQRLDVGNNSKLWL